MLGVRLPASQARSVAVLQPSSIATAGCDSPRSFRLARKRPTDLADQGAPFFGMVRY